jgi:hypothetical protein
MQSYISWIIITIMLSYIVKPIRFYIMSFFFPWLYDHPRISQILGIRYESDLIFETNRKETKLYLVGIFATMFTWFTGMNIETSLHTRKDLMRLQGKYAKNITMEPYFDEVMDKTMTLNEFEDFLSRTLLIETNRVFEILDKGKEKYFLEHIKIVRLIVNGLTGGSNMSIRTMITKYKHVKELIKIMNSVSEAHRMLLFVPHLSLVDGFSKMLIKTNGDMLKLIPSDFFELTSKYFVIVNKGDLVFVTRHGDDRNTCVNRSFGIKGFSCPGALYVIKFIKSIHAFLQSMDITIEGKAIISNRRFKNITNKDDVKVTFRKSDRQYNNDVSDFDNIKEDMFGD